MPGNSRTGELQSAVDERQLWLSFKKRGNSARMKSEEDVVTALADSVIANPP